MNIESYLKQLNLSDKEIETYLVLLELGQSQIVPITDRTRLPRTTTFHILEKLHERSLIEILENKTRRTYVARPPRTILTLLNNEEQQIQEKIATFKRTLPELDRLYKISPFQPLVRFFKGADIRLIYEEMLEVDPKKDAIWYVAETNMISDAFGEDYLKRWIDRRIQKHIPSRSIRVREGEMESGTNAPRPRDYRDLRYAPEGFRTPAHIVIYRDNVGIITTSKESFGTVITSQEYTETMRNWFEELWKVSTED